MRRFKWLESRLARRMLAPLSRLSEPKALAPRGLCRVDHLAWLRASPAAGFGVVLVLIKLFCP